MSDTALPPLLAANPRLDQWVGFPEPGVVRVATGRVEIGQGVLTAMIQIAADELDVTPERIRLATGDTDLTPNEGYTAGSQSIQFGAVALRLALAEARALFLDQAAAISSRPRAELAVEDELIAPSLGHLRRRSQLVEEQNAFPVERQEFRRYPFRAVHGDSRQATQINRIELYRSDVEEFAIPVGRDLSNNLRLADSAGTPNVQGHTFTDQRMERFVKL